MANLPTRVQDLAWSAKAIANEQHMELHGQIRDAAKRARAILAETRARGASIRSFVPRVVRARQLVALHRCEAALRELKYLTTLLLEFSEQKAPKQESTRAQWPDGSRAAPRVIQVTSTPRRYSGRPPQRRALEATFLIGLLLAVGALAALPMFGGQKPASATASPQENTIGRSGLPSGLEVFSLAGGPEASLLDEAIQPFLSPDFPGVSQVDDDEREPTPIEEIDMTAPPYQRAILQKIEQLRKDGRPVPQVNATSSSSRDEFLPIITVRGTTVLNYTGPNQAGKARWDDFIIERPTEGSGTIDEEGNFTQRAIDQNPTIYGPGPCPAGCFEYGEEPRIVNLTEVFIIDLTRERPPIPIAVSPHHSATVGNVLMGRSLGRHIDWTVGDSLCLPWWLGGGCIYEFRVGFLLDYRIGLRLPARVQVNTPDMMVEENDYTMSTSLTPLDFSAADYAAIGLPGNLIFDGNEFEARFEVFLGIVGKVLGLGINWSINTQIDLGEACSDQLGRNCKNFVTPFGVDANGNPRQFPFSGATIVLEADQTGIKVEFAGAGLGVGLGVRFDLGPASMIRADYTATGDATGSGLISYTSAHPTAFNFGPITAGNFNPTTANAFITLDDFRFFFSHLSITFCATLDFTGWLDFIGSTSCREIYTLRLDISDLSLGQHDGTPGVTAVVFVQSFAVDIEVTPALLSVVPGFFAVYTVSVTNLGSVTDTFDAFQVTGLPATWETVFEEDSVTLNPSSSTSFDLSVRPFRHFSTAPGDYPFTVRGRSEGAEANGLVRTDMDSATVRVLPFHELRVTITPASVEVKPGEWADYVIAIQNFGNVPDSFTIALAFIDFDGAFRAVPTVIQASWTALGSSSFGPLAPGATSTTTFMITVPSDWAGMENATYMFDVTATSAADLTAMDTETGDLVVIATKAAMVRFINLELTALIADVTASSLDPDVKRSLLSKLDHAKQKKELALIYIEADEIVLANNALRTANRLVFAFVMDVEAQRGKAIPSGQADDWLARARTIAADLETAFAATTC